MQGPYGEGHQGWQDADVAVLIGGGIGVTPFSSILQDLTFLLRTNQVVRTKHVYFLWVTRSQKQVCVAGSLGYAGLRDERTISSRSPLSLLGLQFEWVVDILKELEEADKNRLVEVSDHVAGKGAL